MARIPSLARSEDFRSVMRAGSRVRRDGITTYSSPGSAATSRLGVAAHARNAVVRNRIKRRTRAAFRSVAGDARRDVVVRADESSLQMDFQQLVKMLERALRSEAV